MINLQLNNIEKNNLNDDEIEIGMARKLEILLLPVLRRNMKFFYAGGELEEKTNAYRNPMDKEKIEETIAKKKQESIEAVCKPLCDIVAEILQENGIRAETISCDTNIFKHYDIVITTKTGKKYIINYLEDIEYIQTGMKTPDFASKSYYERRYKKFEGGTTVDGKSLEGISFLDEDRLSQIDKNLGYKQLDLYMDDVIYQIRDEFSNYRNIVAENEWINTEFEIKKKNKKISSEELNKLKESTYKKYQEMSDDEILEKKLDWIFEYFNERMDINGHADFVMYYSKLLLKRVLSQEEYKKLTRYDGFVYRESIPQNSKIESILDLKNPDSKNKIRFCLVNAGENTYVFSTLANKYVKIDKKEFEELAKYANISKTEKPSDLIIYLWNRGTALPLIFHPLGSKILNDRAELINKDLSYEDRKKAIQELSDSIQMTDEPITSIMIPYPDGKIKYLYINKNNKVVIKEENKETIYHYDEKTESFRTEENYSEER